MNKLNKMTRFNNLGIGTAEVLIPDKCDLEKWAVLACDQYTTDERYWQQVKQAVGEAPSALHMVYPEIELQKDDEATREQKIGGIIANTQSYYKTLFTITSEKRSDGYFYVKRTTSTGVRKGILMCLDLKYVGKDGLFRPSEATIEERMIVRKKIREGATLEAPHIIMLANDKDGLLFQDIDTFEAEPTVYDFDLMENGGRVQGRLMDGEMVYSVSNAVAELEKQRDFVFVVGDGNHALMAAKMHYEQMVKEFDEDILKDHPLRYVLVEVVNIYDPAIVFAPIHRSIIGVDAKAALEEICKKTGSAFCEGETGEIMIESSDFRGALHCEDLYRLQDAIQSLGARVDYINDESKAKSLGAQSGNLTILMPVIQKEELFDLIEKNGALPKKSFSMGEAGDKRYYLEARRITM